MSNLARNFIIGLFISALMPAGAAYASPAALDRVYFFLSKAQSPDGGLGRGVRKTHAQAVVAAAFVRRGHANRARRILDTFDDIRASAEKEGVFRGFAASYDDTGRPLSSAAEPFAQAAVAAAMYNYKVAFGGRRYDKTIDAMAAVYARRINSWGILSSVSVSTSTESGAAAPAASSAVENLCAYYVLSAAAAATGRHEYLRASKKMSLALKDLFYDESRRSFAASARFGCSSVADVPSDGYANILGALFYGPWNPAVAPDATAGVDRLALSELAVAAGRPADETSSALPATAMFLSFPRDVPDGAFIASAVSPGVTEPDYCATALFAFLSERFNPFAIRDERYLLPFEGLAVQRGENWTSDAFVEGAEREFYCVPSNLTKNAAAFAGLDAQNKKTGNFSLRVQFVPSKNEKSTAALERHFYPPQDFASRGGIRFWLAARPVVFTLASTNLKIRLRAEDEKGLWAETPPLNYSGRGVENKVASPAGFAAVAGSRAPDYSKIRKLIWIFDEDTQTSWNINLDDVRIE